MKTNSILSAVAGCIAALICSTSSVRAQDMPEMPKPLKEHAWLEQFAGRWDSVIEFSMGSDKEPMKSKTTEKARMVGGFWIVSEGEGDMMGTPFSSILTLGYDAAKKCYVGTWVDSMTGVLWSYSGNVDQSGKILVLEAEGPCPMQGGKICKFKDIIEMKSKDHKVVTNQIMGEDGKWVTMATSDAKRVK